MSRYRNLIFYVSLTLSLVAIMVWVILQGKYLEVGRDILTTNSGNHPWNDFIDSLRHNLEHPLTVLLVQIITIIMVANLFGWICRKIGQPTVIGEIIAGILLGPSLIGSYFPELSGILFPESSFGNLHLFSQIGLILFMYVVGMELDLSVLKRRASEAVVISHAGIIVPFTLGIILSYFLYTQFAPEGVTFLSFGLFIAIAMSITAFPVLARIVQERGLSKTRLGAMVITCAAADDITAWSLLAIIIAIVKAGSFVSALYTIALAVGYVVVMLKLVRPFLKRVGDLHSSRENLSKTIVALFLVILILSAYTTEVIGIHALFGAFMAGVIMPENSRFRNVFIEKVEDLAMVLLLPIFFVYTGLRTEIGLLGDGGLWWVTLLVVAVAVTGKLVGGIFAARFTRHSWRDSLSIGALMNTRGLMELVVLNIGYDLGVLTPEIFAIMVIMALVTTFMTSPLLDLAVWLFPEKNVAEAEQILKVGKYKIIISFGNPERGRSLLRLAHALVRKMSDSSTVTVMHFSPNTEVHQYNIDEYERESFAPVVRESHLLQQKITTFFKPTNDVDSDIVETVNKGDYDLLLIGIGQSIFDGSLLGKILGFTTRIINPERLIGRITGSEKLFDSSPFDDRTYQIIKGSQIPVGILIDKNFHHANRVLFPVFDSQDRQLLPYLQKMISNAASQVTVVDAIGIVGEDTAFKESIRLIEQFARNQIALIQGVVDEQLLKEQELMVVSSAGWKRIMDDEYEWIKKCPSILIIHQQ